MAYKEQQQQQQHGCSNYMLLKPEEATLVDLLSLLLSSKFKNKRFVECPSEGDLEDKLRGFQRRWLIFISVLLQKLFLLSRNHMQKMGNGVEMLLNLQTSNGGFGRLLFNILRGRVVRPDSTSAKYRCIVGKLDKRVELDSRIEGGTTQYNASLSIMASKLSYDNEAFIKATVTDHWKMKFLRFYNFWNEYQQELSTQAFMFQDKTTDPDLIVVAFRGTGIFDADAWRTDVDLSWYELQGVGKIHHGFMRALGLQEDKGWPKEIDQISNDNPLAYYTIRQMLRDIVAKNEKAKFIVTGHSLGGALAILFLAILAIHEEEALMNRLEGVYTFGQPRVGDEMFGEYMKKKMKRYGLRYLRYVYCNDMVPRLPYDDKTLLFKHFGTCLYYNSFYKCKAMEEEPNKNYFSLFWVIPKILNAVWELARSFILPCTMGSNYKEDWSMKLLRVIGLVIPGLSAHCPRDYVNATQLGSLPLNSQHPLQCQDDLKSD